MNPTTNALTLEIAKTVFVPSQICNAWQIHVIWICAKDPVNVSPQLRTTSASATKWLIRCWRIGTVHLSPKKYVPAIGGEDQCVALAIVTFPKVSMNPAPSTQVNVDARPIIGSATASVNLATATTTAHFLPNVTQWQELVSADQVSVGKNATSAHTDLLSWPAVVVKSSTVSVPQNFLQKAYGGHDPSLVTFPMLLVRKILSV